MAQLFKGHVVDDDAYPMPRTHAQRAAQQDANAVDPGQVAGAAADLERIMHAIAAMGPQVAQVNDALRAGAQQQGYADGLARGQAEVQATVVEAMTALTDAQRQRHELAQANESALAELALRIARRVIAAHLEVDPTLVARIVGATIAELEPTTKLMVHVNPADVTLVEDARAELERLVTGNGTIEITGDDTVARGGCVLVSPVGEVDARIETKLEVLETAFRAQRRQLVEGGA